MPMPGLAWDKLRDHSGVAAHPSPFWQKISSNKVTMALACGIFLFYPVCPLIEGPYADSSKPGKIVSVVKDRVLLILL